MFFKTYEANCDVLSKQNIDEIEEMHLTVTFSTCYVDIRHESLSCIPLTTTPTKAHIRKQILVYDAAYWSPRQ